MTRSKNVHFAKLFVLGAAFAFIIACGDDDSSSFVEPEKESLSNSDSSASVILSSSEGSSPSSSSRVSSSSAKSSSSTDAKSSSSVTSSSSGTSAGSSAGSSSSSLKTCPPEKEGNTRTVMETGEKQLCKDGYWVPMESSSSSKVSSSSYFDMTEQFNEKVSYGEFTDPRDGQKYRTVTIDYKYHMRGVDSVTIFAENLNYGERVPGGTVQGKGTKYCYDDDPWYCDNGWGGLYTWSNAMGFPAVCDSFSVASEKCPNKFDLSNKNENFDGDVQFLQHQGICPEGWHVMNEDIWALLSEMSRQDVSLYMGSKIAGFGKDNLYGISLLPAGYWNPAALEYGHISNSALYWLPRQYPEYDDCAYRVTVRTNEFNKTFRGLKTQGFSVRCVKNY